MIDAEMNEAQALAALDNAEDRFKAAVAAAVYQTELVILRDAQREVPVDTGRLKNSGWATVPNEENPSGIVGFGTTYALRQHETHKEKSKYLQKPFEKHATRGKLARRVKNNYNAGISLTQVSDNGTPNNPVDAERKGAQSSRRRD